MDFAMDEFSNPLRRLFPFSLCLSCGIFILVVLFSSWRFCGSITSHSFVFLFYSKKRSLYHSSSVPHLIIFQKVLILFSWHSAKTSIFVFQGLMPQSNSFWSHDSPVPKLSVYSVWVWGSIFPAAYWLSFCFLYGVFEDK